MLNMFKNMPERQKGMLLLLGGILLLLHTLGIFKSSLNLVVILGSVYMIWMGLVKTGYHKNVQKMLSKDD